jgi:hypothetical protein
MLDALVNRPNTILSQQKRFQVSLTLDLTLSFSLHQPRRSLTHSPLSFQADHRPVYQKVPRARLYMGTPSSLPVPSRGSHLTILVSHRCLHDSLHRRNRRYLPRYLQDVSRTSNLAPSLSPFSKPLSQLAAHTRERFVAFNRARRTKRFRGRWTSLAVDRGKRARGRINYNHSTKNLSGITSVSPGR